MTDVENRRVILNARPVGVPGPEFFNIETAPVPATGEGEFLVRNAFLSADPAMREAVGSQLRTQFASVLVAALPSLRC